MTRTVFIYPGWAFPAERLLPLLRAVGAFTRAPTPDSADALLGWSLGGLHALLHPSDKPRILIAATASFCAEGSSWPGMPRANVRALRRQLERNPEQALRGFFELCFGGPSDAARLKVHIEVGLAIGRAALIEGLEELLRLDARDRLRALRAPILLLHGARDAVIPFEAARATAALSPTAVLREHPEAGHDLPLTNVEWTAAQMRDFLNERIARLSIHERR